MRHIVAFATAADSISLVLHSLTPVFLFNVPSHILWTLCSYVQGTTTTGTDPHSTIGQAAAAAAEADITVAVLGLGQVEREGGDRSDLGFPVVQQQLLDAVRSATPGKPLILVSVSAGPVAVNTSQVWKLYHRSLDVDVDVVWMYVSTMIAVL